MNNSVQRDSVQTKYIFYLFLKSHILLLQFRVVCQETSLPEPVLLHLSFDRFHLLLQELRGFLNLRQFIDSGELLVLKAFQFSFDLLVLDLKLHNLSVERGLPSRGLIQESLLMLDPSSGGDLE